MTEQTRHIAVISIGAVIVIVAEISGGPDKKDLFALVGMLWAGEFGLSRTQSPPPSNTRVDHPVTINQQERREP